MTVFMYVIVVGIGYWGVLVLASGIQATVISKRGARGYVLYRP